MMMLNNRMRIRMIHCCTTNSFPYKRKYNNYSILRQPQQQQQEQGQQKQQQQQQPINVVVVVVRNILKKIVQRIVVVTTVVIVLLFVWDNNVHSNNNNVMTVIVPLINGFVVVVQHPSHQYHRNNKIHYYIHHPTTTTSKRKYKKSSSSSRLLMIAPQQLGSFEPLNFYNTTTITEDNYDKNHKDYTIIQQRYIWLENWVQDDTEQQQQQQLDSNKNDDSNNDDHHHRYIDFQYAWEFQRDVLLRGHLERLRTYRNTGTFVSSFLQFNSTTSSNDGTTLVLPSSSSSIFQKEEDDHDHDHDLDNTTEQQQQQHIVSVNNLNYIRNRILQAGIDTVIILEHRPVYTLGTGSDEKFILSNNNSPTSTTNNDANTNTKNSNKNLNEKKKKKNGDTFVLPPVIRMDRGGEVTYHGPGQITIYPILDLKYNYKPDIHWYIRALEECVIYMINTYIFNHDPISTTTTNFPTSPTTMTTNTTTTTTSNSTTTLLYAYREPNVTGVWIQNKKIAAVGIKCRQWITQHGVAINILQSSVVPYFQYIVPCGLVNRQVGYLNEFLPESKQVTTKQIAYYMELSIQHIFQVQFIQPIEYCTTNTNKNHTTTTTIRFQPMMNQDHNMEEYHDTEQQQQQQQPNKIPFVPPDLNDFYSIKDKKAE